MSIWYFAAFCGSKTRMVRGIGASLGSVFHCHISVSSSRPFGDQSTISIPLPSRFGKTGDCVKIGRLGCKWPPETHKDVVFRHKPSTAATTDPIYTQTRDA